MKVRKVIRKVVCRIIGHDWHTYEYETNKEEIVKGILCCRCGERIERSRRIKNGTPRPPTTKSPSISYPS